MRLTGVLRVRAVVCPGVSVDPTAELRRQDDAVPRVIYVRARDRRAPVNRAHELICSRSERSSCSRDGIEPALQSSVRHRALGHQRPAASVGELVEVEWLVLVLVAQAKYQCRSAHEMWE
jgi:hypothetical protein